MAEKTPENMKKRVSRPPPLEKGNLVALITPAGPVEDATLEGAARLLKSAGLRVNLRADAGERQGYLAGVPLSAQRRKKAQRRSCNG